MVEALRRYKINGWSDTFYTGLTQDGHQLLMGVQFPEIVAVVFGSDGSFERVVSQRLREPVTDPNNHDVSADISKMKARFGFLPSKIEVKEFFVADRWIGIRELPEHYQEVLDHPEHFGKDEARILRDDIQRWLDRGDFVLYWCEDYYLNRDGEVESS